MRKKGVTAMKRGCAVLGALALSAVLLCGCVQEEQPNVVHTLPALGTEGEKIVTQTGDEVFLRGVNAGGLCVTESWMCGFSDARDYLSASRRFIERFGYTAAQNLWYNYRSCWWTAEDFENCAEMGINVIRLPFTYMNVDFAAVEGLENAGKEYDFSYLDEFVNTAEEYGIYTILDLHGAYGSQNGQELIGWDNNDGTAAEVVGFYSDERKLSLTEKLWGAVAAHFKDNPAVAGYDLLNEPGEKAGTTSKPHFDAMDRFYRAIRAAGDEHIVIFESCWGGADIPAPSVYGWENCMYSFHHYTGCSTAGREEEHITSFYQRLSEVEQRNFGVPLQMGEFTCYGVEQQWEDTLSLLNSRGWHWVSWTYKVWGNMGWGIYNIGVFGEQRASVEEDSYEQLDLKFLQLRTATDGRPFAFRSGNTLFSVIQRYSPRYAKEEEA